MSKAKVLAAARRRWGKHVAIEENTLAPSPKRRAEIIADRLVWKVEIEEIKARRCKSLLAELEKLITAAQFVVDVNGDDPSIPQLKYAVGHAHGIAYDELRLKDLEKWEKESRFINHRTRFRLTLFKKGAAIGWYGEIKASADTLAELLEAIEPQQVAAVNGKES